MIRVRYTSLSTKIVALVMVNVLVVLLFTGAALLANDIPREKSRLVQRITSIAEVIGANSTAALAFHDVKALNELLVSLRKQPNIMTACIYEANMKIVSAFSRVNIPNYCPTMPRSDDFDFTNDTLQVRVPILLENQRIGTLLVVSDLRELHESVLFHSLLTAGIFILALLIAFLLSRILQRLVSGPILQLASAAKRVSENRDYTVRVKKRGHDEVALLTDSFNQMLSRIDENNRERESLLNEARNGVRIRDEFMSIASHELKTPITPLKLQVQLIRSLIQRDHLNREKLDKLRSLLDSSDRQISRLSDLVNDLLDVTRITSGQLSLSPEPVTLNSVIRDVIERYQAEITRSGSKLILNLGDSQSGIWDRRRVEQVVLNLLTNALKYGEGKDIVISTATTHENAILKFQDHGMGMSTEDQAKIFNRFERAVSARHYGGLGLGLYIVKQIVVAHGGEVQVESQLGQGSTFAVELPLRALARTA